MKNKYKWNPVYNLVMEIKEKYQEKYQEKFNAIDYHIYKYIDENNMQKEISCLERWVIDLANPKYLVY